MTGSPSANALTAEELQALVERVFRPQPSETRLALITDLPDAQVPDTPPWRDRRALVSEWHGLLTEESSFQTDLFVYRNAKANNADLPDEAWPWVGGTIPADADALEGTVEPVPMSELFTGYPMLIAATQFSTTAPLKLAAAQHGIRAATMPGFSRAMVPALRLDYGEIDRRVRLLADLLTEASGCALEFGVADQTLSLHLDLRHRRGHASGGLIPQAGQAGNLPSGESYIVPYEGELAETPSQTEGLLPVEFDGEVVVYRIAGNRAVEVTGDGPMAERERQRLEREPAYGNMAELGLGVLSDFGLSPIGQVLLDEKLGLHIAFGRSDHFGGQVGAKDFSSPDAVVHIDRVYLPESQPSIAVRRVDLLDADGGRRPLMRDGSYCLEF